MAIRKDNATKISHAELLYKEGRMGKEIAKIVGVTEVTITSWIKKYGVRYFSELTNMAVLTEEVGELARVMARKYGDQSFKEGEKDNVEEEIADVLWVLLCIANQTGVDITEAFARSIEKKTKRDQARHINNPKLSDHGE